MRSRTRSSLKSRIEVLQTTASVVEAVEPRSSALRTSCFSRPPSSPRANHRSDNPTGFSALLAADDVARRWATQLDGGPRLDARRDAFRQRGFGYKEDISPTAEGKWGGEYRYLYEGRRIAFGPQIAIGARVPIAACIGTNAAEGRTQPKGRGRTRRTAQAEHTHLASTGSSTADVRTADRDRRPISEEAKARSRERTRRPRLPSQSPTRDSCGESRSRSTPCSRPRGLRRRRRQAGRDSGGTLEDSASLLSDCC
jgi:hypothetical protein